MTGTMVLLAAIAAGPVGNGLRGRAAAELPGLVAALGSPRFADREAAGRRLRGIGEPALPSLANAARAHPDAEVRQRAADVRDAVEREPSRPRRTLAAGGGRLFALAVSADGRWAAAGGEDKTLHVWDLWTGRLARSVPVGAGVSGLAFHPSGRTLAAATWSAAVLADADTGAVSPLPGAVGHYTAAAFAADGSRLLVTETGRAEWWDTAGRPRRLATHHATGHGNWYAAAAVRPGGRRYAFGGHNWATHVWDADPPALVGADEYGRRGGATQRPRTPRTAGGS